ERRLCSAGQLAFEPRARWPSCRGEGRIRAMGRYGIAGIAVMPLTISAHILWMFANPSGARHVSGHFERGCFSGKETIGFHSSSCPQGDRLGSLHWWSVGGSGTLWWLSSV